MPEYFVTTHAENEKTRVLVIKADYFVINDQTYDFHNSSTIEKPKALVASVPIRNVFAVTEIDQAYQGDFLSNLNHEDDDSQNLLESEEFFDEVYDIVTLWHEPDDEEPLAKVEERLWYGHPQWGVVAEGRFIPFFLDQYYAKEQAENYVSGAWRQYTSEPVEECPLAETIQ